MLTVAYQRGDVVGQLQRRKQVIALADGGGQGLTVGPLQIVGLGVLRGGQSALGLGAVGAADLDAGVLPQTELGGIVVQRLNARQTASDTFTRPWVEP